MRNNTFDFISLIKELKAGLVTSDNIVREELVIKIEDFAATLRKSKITQSSIRKIYDSFKALQLRIHQEMMLLISNRAFDNEFEDAAQKAFSKIKPLIRLMKSKSRYVIERKKKELNKQGNAKKQYDNLQDFINTCVDKINSKKEYDAFMDLFECIIANLKE